MAAGGIYDHLVLRDLAHPDGGFCASEDADIEGEEGTFYVMSNETHPQDLQRQLRAPS